MQSPLVLSSTAFLLFLLLLVTSPAAARAAVNRTIDDELGDSATGTKPVYSPAGSWSQGATCAACRFAPPLLDPTHVRNGTWHDATYSPGGPALTISANFTGSAVYVFNVLAGGVPGAATLVDLTFILDGARVGRFVNILGDRAAFEYDVPVYANASIPHGPHTLTIESGGGANRTNVLFDYILYTVRDHHGGDEDEDDDGTNPSASSGAPLPKLETDDSDPSSDSDSDDDNDGGSHNGGHPFGHRHGKGPDVPVGAIVGGTLGGLALLALMVAAVVFVRRRPRRRQGDDDEKQLHGDPSAGSDSPPSSSSGSPARPILPHRPTIPGWSTRPSAVGISTGPARPTVTMGIADDSFKESYLPAGTTKAAQLTVALPSIAATKRAQRQAELAYQLKALEAQMRGLQADYGLGLGPSSKAGEVQGAMRTDVSTEGVPLQGEILALRDEVADLRRQLVSEQRAVKEPDDAPPQYEPGA